MPAATYRVKGPDGNTYQVDGPDGATDEQVIAEVIRQNPHLAAASAQPVSAARQKGRDVVTGADSKDDSFAGDLVRNARAVTASALNGATFGFGDEIAGAASALLSAISGGNAGEGYDSGRDFVRGVTEQHRKGNPIASTAASVGGSVLTPGAIVKNITSASPLARMVPSSFAGRAGAAAGAGGTLGAVQGAGDAETIGDIPQDAALGALTGAATAGTLNVGGTVLRNARDMVAPRFSGAAAMQLALERVGLALVRDEKTGEMVVRRMAKLGDESRMADAGGKSTLNLLDTVATMPGATTDQVERAIRQRQVSRADRLETIADDLSGGRAGADVFEALQQQKKAAAGPLYEKVNQTDVPLTGALAELSQRPVMKDAMEQARINAANKGPEYVHALDEAAMNEGQMPLRFWDDVKKGLDDVIGKIKRSPGDSNKAASTLSDALAVKRQLLSELDNLTTDPQTGQSLYKSARDAFAGPAALQNAIEDGRAALNMSSAEINQAMFKMSASEREAFQLGAADALRDKVGTRGGQNNLLAAPFDKNTRMQLNAIFGDTRGYREAMSKILAEGSMKRLEGVGRGSQTASRESRIEDMNQGVIESAANAAAQSHGGGVASMALQYGKSLAGRLGTPEAVRDEIGRILLSRGPDSEKLLQQMRQIIEQLQGDRAQNAAIQGVLGASGASILR
jgi:hypothetical protein